MRRTVPMGIPMPRKQGVFDPKMRTFRPEFPEDLWNPIYDRMNYAAAGTTQIRFFSIALGGSATLITAGAAAAKNKTYRDTNWLTSGADLNRAYEVHGVGKCYVPLQQAVAGSATPSILDDMCRLDYGGYLELKTNANQKVVLPLFFIPTPAQFRGQVATTATNTTIISGGGSVAQKDYFRLEVPLIIEPGQTIEATMNWDGTVALNQTMDIYLIFAAFTRKPS